MIYTHVGAILVAVNPFERLNIYGPSDISKASNVVNSYPHVFITASTAYQQLRNNLKNQSVLISGESGAGKTETTKKVLNYLANVAPGSRPKLKDEPGVEEKILQSNPLLEALGNAKTLRNDNSSRFGKWMKVDFDHSFRIQGCEIVNYLLEKSRVVTQNHGERGYHIFYQIIAGCDDAMKRHFELLGIEDYLYLNTTGCYSIPGVDDAAEYRDVRSAMNTLQFSPSLQSEMIQVIIAILSLGNIRFEVGPLEATSKITAASSSFLAKCCSLLGLQVDGFKYALTEKRVQMGRGSVVSIKLDVPQAIDSKDSLSKALYSNMFDWVIGKVNETLRTTEAPFSIGILDIFGFEVFDVNSFEQLCINYANEKLQFHFNEVIFSEEMKMYVEEGVPAEAISFVDNGECVNLIEGKPFGLLSLLDEECSLGKATDLTYASKIENTFGKNKSGENRFFTKHKTKPEAFTVHHFAGPVEYVTYGFLDKNKDSLSATLHEVMALSTFNLVAELFATDTGDASLQRRASAAKPKAVGSKSSLGGQFRNQLIGLVAGLKLTEPHFIRCVKPNHQKKPGIFDGQLALRQLRYAGLFEAIRIRQSGFAYRQAHGGFCRLYCTLVDGLTESLRSNAIDIMEAAYQILDTCTNEGIIAREHWRVGKTKTFIKTSAHRLALERQRVKRVEIFAIRMQAFARGVLAKLRINAKKYEAIKQQQKYAAEMKQRTESALIIQKNVRGYIVRRALAFMSELVNLRKALTKRDVSGIELVLKKLEDMMKTERVATIFVTEVEIAKTMVKLIKIQDRFVRDLEKAIERNNIYDLNRLLVKCERLDLSTHPVVLKGREMLTRLQQKRKIMKTMVDFLQNENEYCEIIPETLEMALDYDVDLDFIAQVQRIYESASPRLRARNNLRRAIETIDKDAIVTALQEVEGLQLHHPRFGEMEIKSAKNMLKLVDFESLLVKKSFSIVGPRLSDELLQICHELCSSYAEDKSIHRQLRKKLFEMVGSQERFEMVVRSYKWSKVCCTWKYPEVTDVNRLRTMSSVATEEQGEFFGFRPADARTSVHVICSLHRDFDPIIGEIPASLQVALGALDMLDETKIPNTPAFVNDHQRKAHERLTEFEKSFQTHNSTNTKMVLKGATYLPKKEDTVQSMYVASVAHN